MYITTLASASSFLCFFPLKICEDKSNTVKVAASTAETIVKTYKNINVGLMVSYPTFIHIYKHSSNVKVGSVIEISSKKRNANTIQTPPTIVKPLDFLNFFLSYSVPL